MKNKKRKILFGLLTGALCIVICGIPVAVKVNSDAAIPTDKEIVEYSYSSDIDFASLTLFVNDKTFTFSPSFLSSYIYNGSYEEDSGTLVLKDTSGAELHFRIKKDKLVFRAEHSAEVVKFKYAPEDDEPTPAFPDGAVFALQ